MNGVWLAEHVIELILGLISAGVLAGFKVMSARLKKLRADDAAQRDGLQALLRDGIITRYDKYMQRGYIYVRELENVQSMYNAYHALGGNGTLTRLMEELRELPHNKVNEDGQ